ncbi:hypothetical protein LOTGIDRAFT_105163 [Lottia gigantea]|uniref:Uncharacterized protein n=1 Tax=Lottia gigantea TaxID=225164 RepID=V3ZQU0_LOTGI|nr:hypothetical protein LOTGIDRAFT_105163 [Lottia gigantea]ESO93788.1 hypothetical protein LOTGIDRAFT_105163 [Lottia gigantea]
MVSKFHTSIPHRTKHRIIYLLLLHFLVEFAQGNGPGDDRVNFETTEGLPPGTTLGVIPTRSGYTYQLDRPNKYFVLNSSSGVLVNKLVLDRDTSQFSQDVINLFALGSKSQNPPHPVEILIKILDINDNRPVFQEQAMNISFGENAKGAQHIIVTATDIDLSENGTVSQYDIISGNHEGKFQLIVPSSSSPFMYIEVIGDLDRELKDQYILNISARDNGIPPLYGFLSVNISVSDVNDNPPIFNPSEYKKKILEDAKIGQSVIRVIASDADSGLNKEIVYSLLDETGQFMIEEKTGIVRTLTKPLKCSRVCGRSLSCSPYSCLLTVIAEDRGTPALSDQAYISVSIVDTNDHSPVIIFDHVPDNSKDYSSVDENTEPGKRVASISVQDADTGINSETSIQITRGNELGHFKLFSFFTLNIIRVAGHLDREKLNFYNLTVVATDKGIPPRSSTAFLIIKINDANDHAPVFERSEYSVELQETSLPESFVASVKATDLDSGLNSDLVYTIEDGNSNGWFKIDSGTGLMTIQSPLDHEIMSSVKMNVSARDGGSQPFVSFTQVSVVILDENDEIPTFNQSVYPINMEENLASGIEVVTIKAEDRDRGINGTIKYSFHPDVHGQYPNTFTLDQNSGKITTLKSFDRESVSAYTLKLIARDQGIPSLSSTTTINIRVLDVNDNTPKFYPDIIYGNIQENRQSGTEVVRVAAVDPDEGENGRITYSIVGNDFNSFQIDSGTGWIRTTRQLNRNAGKKYDLVIRAVDGKGRSATNDASVKISVTAVDEVAPVFRKRSYAFEIDEDGDDARNQIGRRVGVVSASSTTGSPAYSIAGGDQFGVFSINDQTGEITTNKKIDREEKDEYDLKVLAIGPSKFRQVIVTVKVKDINDNSPRFRSSAMSVEVIEDWPIGHNIFLAEAIDADDGVNGKVTYRLQTSSDYFGIKSPTGVIYLKKAVVNLPVSSFDLKIIATDGGSPQKSSLLELHINIIDVNDHTPVFQKNQYEVSIYESKPVNEIIFQLLATDDDKGKNSEMFFKIIRGNDHNRFGIFPDGTLYVAHQLDREEHDLYMVTVVVCDRGESPRSSTSNITINILDDNDNTPVFMNSTFHFYVSENQPSLSYIGQVMAKDADSGPNAELTFWGDGQKNFTIDAPTGRIYTARQFNREYVLKTTNNDFFSFYIYVKDNGRKPNQARALIKVHIQDENDNPPVFPRHIYTASVMEDSGPNTNITIVTAVDADDGPNAVIKYSISESDSDLKFNIREATGQIYLTGKINREEQSSYTLVVTATDSGDTVQHSSSTTVIISVADINDNKPVSKSAAFQKSVDLSESVPLGYHITTFTAIDADSGNNAVLFFNIVSGNNDNTFNIDAYSGRMYLTRTLDYERKAQYDLEISVSDAGSPSLSTTHNFIVQVMDANDNIPVFQDTSSSVTISESKRVNSSVTIVRATDKDSGGNGRVQYIIAKQEPVPDHAPNHFRIDVFSGEIFIQREIDREQTDKFFLTIIATDMAVPVYKRLSAMKTITIIVTDINDHAPVFESMNAMVVPARSKRGYKIGTVLARDQDAGNNGLVAYQMVAGDTSLFSLQSTTGELTLSQDLPASAIYHTITVQAQDDGGRDVLGQKSTRMEMTIIISSSNDGPIFTNIKAGNIEENEPPGKGVTNIQASATQSGVNVEYYVTKILANSVPQPRYFSIDKLNGLMKTTQVLDREYLPEIFEVEVTAIEVGGSSPKTRSTKVQVRLGDQNDTPPRFSSQWYIINVPVDQDRETSFFKVNVDDPDTVGDVVIDYFDMDDGKFSFISSFSGALFLNESLQYHNKSVFKFKLQANDGIQTSEAIVEVHAINHKPVFEKSYYSFEVPEDASTGTTIANIAATDLDEGPEGHVTYELQSDWGKDKFRLDANFGTFTLIDRLDFEEIQMYGLMAIAKDGSIPPRSATVSVFMSVKDINDNPPEFDQSEYKEEVAENAVVGTTVIDVIANDKDTGRNAEVQYSLIGGDELGQFGIGPVNGTIYTTAKLDREAIRQYTLLVLAIDQSTDVTQRLSSTGTVVITLKDVNDSPPEFVTPSTIFVREDSQRYTTVYTIVAHDKDEGDNSKIDYSLSSGSSMFTIESSTGNVKVTQPLDRETRSNYSIQVMARDQGTPQFSATLDLVIQIEDANDNAPKFDDQSYTKTVAENISIGTSLLKVSATDRDEGLNGVVRYLIIAGDENYDFNMDLSSGVLRVQKALDFEEVKSYTLTVMAVDSSVGLTLNSTVKVTITVTDINDFEPIFVNSPYYAYVQENMNQLPVPVLTISARDNDSGSNSRLIYDIRSEEEEQKIFSMNSQTGEITANLMLDREKKQEYELIIVAFDGGHPRLTGSGLVTVYVKDVNDHAPVFESYGPYTGHVTENMPPETSVLTVQATDADEENNAEIIYSLEDTADGKFSILPKTGEIVTLERLDREVEDQYYLKVIATDQGIPPLSATSQVIIYVDDDNDNAPQFEHHNYTQMILDATQTGEFVLGVTALDRDIGNNGKVTYKLEGQDANMFNINTNTGVVTAAQRLSGNSITFIFSVRATDQGATTKSQVVSVYVKIQRIDDARKPIFSPFSNNLELKENTNLGFFVTTVRATAPRTGKISYHIAGGNIGHGFTINMNNGTITVAGTLDYEITDSMNLWIEANDGGNPPVSAYKQLPIRITDVNDNMPRFKQSFYSKNIEENTAKFSTLIQIEASDADSGNNGHVMFGLTGGNKNNTFRINSNTGVITTNNIIDREGIDLFHLVVEASDMGSPDKKTSTATVKVTVQDQNDNPPKFTHQFRTSVPEDISVNSFIIQITSTDKDLDSNAIASYELLSETNKFAIDRLSGNLSTITKLDAEDRDTYSLQVRAVDESFSVTTYVSLRILDVNDNAPIIYKNTMNFDFHELQAPNTPVGRLSASDIDISSPNNQFFYSLKRPSSLFDVDAETGTISALKTMTFIHSEEGPSTANLYQLDVVVTDIGSPPMSSEAQININVVDANNHAPVFEEDSFTSAVPENSLINDIIIKIVAVDEKDFGINAKVEYDIIGGNGTSYFTIDKLSGEVIVSASLSGQKNRHYSLLVEARDKGHPVKKASTEVHLQITDVNNYRPEFIGSSFEASIIENLADKIVGTLRATDDDDGLNGQVQYLITGGDSEKYFTIGKTTGAITTVKKLDYETKKVYSLDITARDMGLHFKQSSITFTVNVEDENDNSPVFSSTILTGYVPENSPSDTEILQVVAEDADTAPNDVIHYEIMDTTPDAAIFDIVKDTGMILLKGSVDYESKNTYVITVQAFNPTGSDIPPSLTSDIQVFIYVTSVNEYRVEFVKKQYAFNVSESAPINTMLGNVQATDLDEGVDKIAYFYFMGSSNVKGFAIHPLTGVIFINGRPDYESNPQIELVVLVKNRGSVRGNDTDECKVLVGIEDANDPPVFDQKFYTAFVPENSQADVNILKVSATDYDIQAENRQFTYAILSGNIGGWFWMDRVSGMIKTTGQGVLDRETTPVYNITVGAIDSGKPPQTGSATVKIELQDVNDNKPIFSPHKLIINFTETNVLGSKVVDLSVHTTDPDINPNQGPFQYQEVTNPFSSMFDILPTGIVTIMSAIDRETLDHYTIPVKVTDNGNPKMTSTLTFTVTVLDANDSPPLERPLKVLLNVLDSSPSGGKIADIRPLDNDLIGSYSCQIESGSINDFSIPQKCDLVASNNLDTKSHRLSVSGSDGFNGDVNYEVTVEVEKFSRSTLEDAVALRLSSISIEDFLSNSYSRFTNGLKSLLGNQKTIILFSLQKLESDILVFLAVKDIAGDHLSRSDLISFLQNNINNLELATGFVIKETAYSTCHDDMCKNGGSCVYDILLGKDYDIHNSDNLILTSAVPSFKIKCKCPASFSGPTCEIPVGHCGDTYCYNGGTCDTSGSQEVCRCTEGWNGPSCQTDKNECNDFPCKNGATCINLDGSFKCKCVSGFHGQYCESSYYCASIPCQNGGTCNDLDNGFSCDCVFGYFGTRCEKSSVGFEEGSYLEYQAIQDYSSVDMHVYFATVKENALILFNPVTVDGTDVGYLAMEVVDGFMRFSIKLGSENPTRLQVNTKVTSGKWFRVDVQTSPDVTILKVVLCDEGSTTCNQCIGQNPSCYDSKPLNFGKNFVNGIQLSIGGIRNIENILSYSGEIRSHDFIGCMHSFTVNGLNVLDTELAANFKSVTSTCPRRSYKGLCTVKECHNSGICVDDWSVARCRCSDKHMGDSCEQAWQPSGFAPNAKVTFKLRESYLRDQQLKTPSNRKKRAVDSSEVYIRFRTLEETGALFYSSTVDTNCVLWLEDGKIRFVLTPPKAVNDPLNMEFPIADGDWHNITITSLGSVFAITVDGQRSQPKDFGAGYIFSSLDVKEMVLSGQRIVPPSGQSIMGFDGCISEFRIDNKKLPFDGKTEKYSITVNGSVESGCKALCLNNPCGDGNTCIVSGEAFVCKQIAKPSGGLDIGIVVVIVFFIILIIVILIVFILFRRKRSLFPCKGGDKKVTKSNGVMARDNADSTLRGMPIYGTRNEDLLQNQLTEDVTYQKNSALSSRPDLIGSNFVGRPGSRPQMFEDGTVIIENGELEHINVQDDEMPEHYDLENASSIAPSDIDVIQHYKQYRNGDTRYKPNFNKTHHRSRESPLNLRSPSAMSRDSPNVHKFHNNAHTRQSPVSLSGSALSMPSRPNPHLNTNGINRPASAQAVYMHGTHHRNSPITQLNIRQNPASQHNSSRSSLGSHHSHSTNSSVPRNNLSKPMRNGKPKHVKGLTVEEINRLNARPGPPSPASMLEAVSSSSDELKRKRKMKPVEHIDGTILLEPPDSSSSDSGANDSFTCSEFEFENDHRKNDFDPDTMIFSKLTEVENENDDIPVPIRSNSDGMHSNCDSFTSTIMSSEEHFLPQKGPHGAFNMDSLLNWGPNFDKLVGVFKDIALLPDSETQPLEGGITTDHEEYV